MEWSKNYRVKGGNVPFCFSVAWLALPGGDAAVTDTTRFWYTSAYVEDDSGTRDLITAAELRARSASPAHASLIAGHQLCSDLAVLAAAAAGQPAGDRGREQRLAATAPGRPRPAAPTSTPATTPGTSWPASRAGWSTSAPTCGWT